MTSHQLLIDLEACEEAQKYASNFESLQDAWNSCEEPEWMLWLLGRVNWKNNLNGIVDLAKKWAADAARADQAAKEAADAALATKLAARVAAEAAAQAAYWAAQAAELAAYWAARAAKQADKWSDEADTKKSQCDDIRNLFPQCPQLERNTNAN
jgi:hypothetical protein